MDIYISNRQRALRISNSRVRELVEAVIDFERWDTNEVSVHFVGKEEICALHAEYFDDPSQTDCISFPVDEDENVHHHVLGEVIVCPQAAIDYVEANGGDVYQETSLYIVHGLLHLMGYDDIKDSDRSKMRKAEERHMNQLKTLGLAPNP